MERLAKSLASVQRVSKIFGIDGELRNIERIKVGHINETYAATYDSRGRRTRYIHQKINAGVFQDPIRLMDNIVRVTGHARLKLSRTGVRDIESRVLTVVNSPKALPYVEDNDGLFWRTYRYIEAGETRDSVQSERDARAAGKAFGEFQRIMLDLPGPALYETIPDFHNVTSRLKSLLRAVELNTARRVGGVKREIEFALSRIEYIDVIQKAFDQGTIPRRLSHNDAKFNNVMLEKSTCEPLAVLDLDTVMHGSSLYDIGDLIRTTTCRAQEDERDLSRIQIEISLFEELIRGYLGEASFFLTEEERSLIAFSGILMTYMVGMRFLTDYLSGDTYFRIARPAHNLERTRVQWQLLRSLEENRSRMEKIVERFPMGGTA